LIDHGATFNSQKIFHDACEGGNVDIIDMVTTIYYPDLGLKTACANGCYNVIDLMISKGAQNLNEGLKCAIDKKYTNTSVYMFIHGAKPSFDQIEYNEKYWYAIATMKINITLEYKYDKYWDNWNRARIATIMNYGIKFQYNSTTIEREFTQYILNRKLKQKKLYEILMTSKSKLKDKNIAKLICNFMSFKDHRKE
jgi:hypothetical protein